MSEAPSTPVLPTGLAEDWVQSRDVFCPSCRYNLRMLHVPRCPECGLIFRWQALLRIRCPRCDEGLFTTDADECPRCKLPLDWQRLLDSAHPEDIELFEHTDRPIRAALRTWLAALRPRRFWQAIPLETPPVVGRLVRLRQVAVVVCLLGLGLITWLGWQHRAFTGAGDPLIPFAMVLTLPVVTTIGLPLFTPTLARFRVRRDQLLRCLAYATSGLFWIGVCFLLAALMAWTVNTFWPNVGGWGLMYPRIVVHPNLLFVMVFSGSLRYVIYWPTGTAWFNIGLGLILLGFGFVWWWVFLYASLRRYLRLNRRNAVALLLSTQIIGLLLLATFILLTSTVH